MDASKVKASSPVQSAQPVKRSADNDAQSKAQAQAAAPQKSPYDTPRQTVNSQGQTIGARINYKA